MPVEGGYTQKSWDVAKSFVTYLGPYPSSFTSVVRLLSIDHSQNPVGLSEIGEFLVRRLLKSPSLQSCYFHALKTYRPEILDLPPGSITPGFFAENLSSEEHAVLLTVIFLYKSSRRLCSSDILQRIIPRLYRHADLGFLVGDAMPAIGAGSGMLLGSMRVFSLVPFIINNPTRFVEYWLHLHKQSARYVDPQYEYESWGCNSLQIAALLAQQFGLGVKRTTDLMYAISTVGVVPESSAGVMALRYADIWINSLLRTSGVPDIPLPPMFYPNREDLEKLLVRSVNAINSSPPHWLDRTKDDISPEKTPQIFFERESHPEDERLPDDLQDAIGADAAEKISEKILEEMD